MRLWVFWKSISLTGIPFTFSTENMCTRYLKTSIACFPPCKCMNSGECIESLVQSSSLVCTYRYCKRCYFRVTKFSRLAAQKHIRGLLNSRWADAHVILVVLQIFSRVFEFALAEFARNTQKLMYRKYFHFYNMLAIQYIHVCIEVLLTSVRVCVADNLSPLSRMHI